MIGRAQANITSEFVFEEVLKREDGLLQSQCHYLAPQTVLFLKKKKNKRKAEMIFSFFLFFFFLCSILFQQQRHNVVVTDSRIHIHQPDHWIECPCSQRIKDEAIKCAP